MRVVIDTNVLVSAIMTSGGIPARVLDAWLAGEYSLVLSSDVLLEIADVLARPHIQERTQLMGQELADVLDNICKQSLWIDDVPAVPDLATDRKDTKFLALAKAAGAHAIVSGDAHLLDLGSYEGIPILTPRAFLDSLARQENDS
jgi:putative PIN family toxin of toxin-antitoxin system